jgi:SAM-dependent methyltransferase
MRLETVARLLALNRQFYQTFSLQFSATRQRIQPGVRRIIHGLSDKNSILDLGCGNGGVARELLKQGYQGSYVGLDSSRELLDQAQRIAPGSEYFLFLHADLSTSGWPDLVTNLGSTTIEFQPDIVLAFAVLHHLPGEDLRLQVLDQVLRLLAPGGRFVFSVWHFLNSARWRNRIQPWESVGIAPDEVDPEDYLLDWRSGGFGLRYVHHFSEEELGNLAADSGFSVTETFYSDGEAGRLGLYQSWVPSYQV